MMRLYCAELNLFVDPTDRNVLVWFQQDRMDPTIGNLQTFYLYEATRQVAGEKEWDEKKQRIREGRPRTARVSGRYRLHSIPWSGLYDRNNRPIFHGDVLRDPQRPYRVCDVRQDSGVRFLLVSNGTHWNFPSVEEMAREDSAILNPHLVSESIRSLFVYPNPEHP